MMVFEAIQEFVYKYFLTPGYDWIDTPTYGLILGILVIFAVIPILKKLNVKLDKRFFTAIAPFILVGATARELVARDLGYYALADQTSATSIWVSPWIFFTMFILTGLCVAIGLIIAKKSRLEYHKITFVLGGILALYNLFLILNNLKSIGPLFFVFISSLLIMAAVWLGSSIKQLSFLRNELNIAVVGAHILDASATYVGIDFLGFSEQHVLPSLLIEKVGSAIVMFPLKLIVLIPALYLIDDELKNDETSRRFIKFVVFILGIGPAIRDIIMMII